MSTDDRLKDHVQSIVDSIENGYYSKDNLEVMQEDNPEELNTWYVYDHENNQVLDNEWFETEKEAQDYLEGHEGVMISGLDYLADCLDINWILNNDRSYKGARVLVAFGGPNIWIDTESKQVEGYWWNEKCIISYHRDEMEIDEALEQLFHC